MDPLVGILLGGFLSLAGSFGAVSLQARHQRNQTRAKDLWDRRAGLYLDLLTHLSGKVSLASDSNPFLIGYGPRSTEDYQLRQQLHARVALFASQEVRDLWSNAADEALFLAAETVEGGHQDRYGDRYLTPDPSRNPEYARLATPAEDARAKLVERLRAELAVDQHLSA
ncbi:hypothetical protein [Streptomyces sp. NBC_01602]|uniref:hypothetical protein n=1 Tax=Streptomyces sp. NBC_01602 TaxID=2975893 RepID=UPI003863DD0C